MAEALKLMYSPAFVKQLSGAVRKEYPPFDAEAFQHHFSSKEWKEAELKRRVQLIALWLHRYLPEDYGEALKILLRVSTAFAPGYGPIFFPEFVERFGQDHWDLSMRALEVFTRTSSAEFAIRSFILKDEKKAMKQMLKWASHKDEHVRRLASEGSRPRLPWGTALRSFISDPSPTIPVLEKLRNDDSLYVRKSVANHLNDISKDHPDLALDIARKWKGESERTDWIVKHAMRGLLKKGNAQALALFGFGHKGRTEVHKLKLRNKAISIGDHLNFSFEIHLLEKEKHRTRIEYVIDYKKAGGKTSPKVFQVAEKDLLPGVHTFNRKQSFMDMTTRKHNTGEHKLSILVNGKVSASVAFDVI